MEFKDLWDVESAMKVITHPTVDGQLWAEAVKWLILYGPPYIRRMLLQASSLATDSTFPQLRPSQFTNDGHPLYNITDLAQAMGISMQEVLAGLQQEKDEFEELFLAQDDADPTVH
jgi:hypothetical protein